MSVNNNTEDLRLLKLFKQGDNTCFELLYKRYNGKIYNFIMKISGGDNYIAEDIVQNVFVKLWEDQQKIKSEGSFSALLFTMSKNLFCDHVRKVARQNVYKGYLLENFTESHIDSEIEYKLLESEIDKLIMKLPPARRKVYLLSKKEHFTNKEIAKHLNISEKTVEAQLTSAMKFMRKSLALRLGIPLMVFLTLLL